jgi:hypothetical protein
MLKGLACSSYMNYYYKLAAGGAMHACMV